MTTVRFQDRKDAGRRLAESLAAYAGRPGLVVLALPRGGVVVGAEVARALGVPLDVMVVRKLGVPGHEELAMGAIASGGIRIVSEDVVRALGLSERDLAAVAAAEEANLTRSEQTYGAAGLPELRDRTVLLVDDGLATGATMRAAAAAVRSHQPARVVVAVPVAPAETCKVIRGEVDEVVCLVTPDSFRSVGDWYEDFSQTTEREVREMLGR